MNNVFVFIGNYVILLKIMKRSDKIKFSTILLILNITVVFSSLCYGILTIEPVHAYTLEKIGCSEQHLKGGSQENNNLMPCCLEQTNERTPDALISQAFEYKIPFVFAYIFSLKQDYNSYSYPVIRSDSSPPEKIILDTIIIRV